MKSELPSTRFLTAVRSSPDDIEKMKQELLHKPILATVLDGLPVAALLLDANRQIVLANKAAVSISSTRRIEDTYGLRPGELINCIHATETTGGCGTTESCSVCGAGKAILCSQQDKACQSECRVLKTNGEAMDLRVWASPFTIDGEQYTLFSVMDITDEKRRRTLERLFFHDVMNMMTAVQASAGMMKDVSPQVKEELAEIITTASDKVVEEIEAQKDLTAAESGDLVVNMMPVDSLEILHELASFYEKDGVSRKQRLEIVSDSESIAFATDKRLLFRVLGNMVKNALEAIGAGNFVQLKSERLGNRVRFSVHNLGLIPDEVRLQIFQRSFSTKGSNRGLGTYSIKLLSERYLKGKVNFTSTKNKGTTFFAEYPIIN